MSKSHEPAIKMFTKLTWITFMQLGGWDIALWIILMTYVCKEIPKILPRQCHAYHSDIQNLLYIERSQLSSQSNPLNA